MAHPLLFDGTWLQQGKYESAEAFYQQVLAGTGGAAAAGTSKVRYSERKGLIVFFITVNVASG